MRKEILIYCLAAGVSLGAGAQLPPHTASAPLQAAEEAMSAGHYAGARQQLQEYMDGAGPEKRCHEEAEALALVCDYVMARPGTADRMGEWVEEHPAANYAAILPLFQRNLLIKENRQEEATALFLSQMSKGIDAPDALPYPLSNLAEELYAYLGTLYRLAGEHHYDRGEYAQAAPYLEAGERTRTSTYKLAMCRYKSREYAVAGTLFEEAANGAEDELAQGAWLHAGLASARQGDKVTAGERFRKAAALYAQPSMREQALYNYAVSLHERSSAAPQQGEEAKETTARAINTMEQFLNEFPASAHATTVSQCLSSVYMTRRDFAKALSALDKVASPGSSAQADRQIALYNIAFQELSSGQTREALTHATQAVALGNHNAEAYAESYYVKGDCNYRLGNYSQAADDLNTAINLGATLPAKKLKNNTYAIYSYAYTLFKLQKYNSAIAQFQKVTAQTDAPTQMKADALNRMGDCYLNMRDYDEANARYTQAKATSQTMGDYSMLQLAYVEGLRGNYAAKVTLIRQMLNEYPASSLRAQALYEQGRAHILSGHEDEAAAVFGTLATVYPQSDYAKKATEELGNMAANIAIRDSIAAEREARETALAREPVDAAQRLFNAGQYDQAEKLLNEAVDKGIGKPYWLARAFVLLSDVYRAQGREVEATQTLESLSANYKEDDDIRTMVNERKKK